MKKAIRLIASVSIIFSIILEVVAAQPWGNNYAYQDISGYLTLLLFMTWSVTPYLYLFHSSRLNSKIRIKNMLRTVIAFIICVIGIGIFLDVTFIHRDAQGGLVFLILPIFQWLVIGVSELSLVFVRSKNVV
jgi:hypothetical protein